MANRARLVARDSAPTSPFISPGGSPVGFFANAGADTCKVGMEKLKYLRFGGKLAEYPSWKDDWNQLVHLRLDVAKELLQLRSVIPSEAKIELRNLRTLEDTWKYLAGEYGWKD